MDIIRKFLSLALFMTLSLSATTQDWLTDFEQAKSMSQELSKPILLVFQGSDWCAPCIQLERKIWSTETFKSYAEEKFILFKADFPRRKKNALSKEIETQNKGLAESYNERGIFPLVVVIDHDGKIIGETGYKKISADAYVSHLDAML